MRGKGEGSIYRRADGYWVGAVEAGRDPVTGRRRRLRIVRRYRRDVLAAIDELKRQAATGIVPDTRAQTAGQFFDWWLADVMAGQVAAESLAHYRNSVARVKPTIGHVRMSRLTVPHLQQTVAELHKRYSPRTVSVTMVTVRSALRWAVGAGLIASNPAEHVTMRGAAAAKVDDALTETEAKAVLAAADDDPLRPLWTLAVRYGLRQGELINLRWRDVDLQRDELTVYKSKTRAGERSMPLLNGVRRLLVEHQEAALRSGPDDLVFTADGGRPLSGTGVLRRWNVILERAGIEHRCSRCGTAKTCSTSIRRFHASRHTAATLLLGSGVALEVVSAILGHADISVTASIYARVRSDLKRQGLSAVEDEDGE
jgi:integrase